MNARDHTQDDGQLLRPDTAMLHPSPTNPRQTFAEEPLQELAESIRQHGIMQPIVVREMPEAMRQALGTEARLEIVAGERRWRAANIAGLLTVPVLLRDLTDEQVQTLQIIENLQREGLSAIEEAEGYEKLRKQGMSAAQIAESVGKSKAYIHAKLKLLELGPEGRDKLRAGEMSESVALLVARVPASLQARAVARVCELDYSGNRPSVRSAANILQNHFTKDLDRAWFAQDDEALVSGAGPCTHCPKRLDHQTGDEDDADVCTDPICFEQKQDAHTDRLRADAIKAGRTIISGADAKAIQPMPYGVCEGGYVALNAKCYELEDYPTYRELLEKVPGAVEVALLDIYPENGLQEIVQKQALSDALRGAGIELHVRDTTQEAQDRARKEAELQAENQFRARLFNDVRSQPLLILATPDLQMLAEFCVRALYEQSRFKVAKLYYPDETNRTAVERLQERIPNMDDTELIGLLRDTLLIGETKKEPWQAEDAPTRLLAAAERIGIDPQQVRAEIERDNRTAATVYRHPDDPGTEWDGTGEKPLWIEAWESLGKSIDDLAVKITPATKKKGKKQ
ncbi:MAG: ParB/RepB/Spo0J family partition protein [Proteobacteria bacterium]|nr:ParB/RepB/Spo0J family partition protein [Pseudomonadota bacterium]